VNYAEDAFRAMAKELGYDEVPPEDVSLVLLYTMLGLTLGEAVERIDVHDAWALWTVGRGITDHPSLVPFKELAADVQALDDPYVDAIRRFAAQQEEAK
jgi:hypothetical protein